jgi:hypothetical protein
MIKTKGAFYPSLNYQARLGSISSRREFLVRSGMGIGGLGLSAILAGSTESALAGSVSSMASASPLAPKQPPLKGKARAVIHLFAAGGPSQVDTWDPKPQLNKYDGKTIPGHNGLAYGSPFRFSKSGRSGIETSEVFPELAQCVDDMAVIRSLWTDIPAHDVASRFLHTGSTQLPKPSIGSWVVYGLGTENQNMPGFITIGGESEWRQAGFLPGYYQGCNVNYSTKMNLEDVILNIRSEFSPLERQRRQLSLLRKLNDIHAFSLQRDTQLESRIETFEMAFKMQTEATDAFDLSKEPQSVRDRYGKSEIGAKLLVARRLVEAGVRFVQVEVGGWDHHGDLERDLPRRASEIDAPAAALLKDLKQRGLLESTLVIWGGEFGRTVTRDANGTSGGGRDHNGRCMSGWLAGGGVRGGITYGATDEFGARAVANKVHIHDLHATILALLGFDHEKLIYRYNGRDFRLTETSGKVVTDVIA